MSENSKIEWTHHTFNAVWGCTKVSAGCKNCYADTLAHRYGYDVWGPGKPRRTFGAKHWAEPLKWNAAALKAGERHRVFCSSMADVFEDHPDVAAAREQLWALIEQTPQLDWLLLTKRPEHMTRFAPASWATAWPRNVWAGTSVEDQAAAEKRIPLLLDVPAVVRFLSCEPLLESVDLRHLFCKDKVCWYCGWDVQPGRCICGVYHESGVHWVIVGGESGPGARPMDEGWAGRLMCQCTDANVAFFMKQMGSHGRKSKGGDETDIPEDLFIREFPVVAQQ